VKSSIIGFLSLFLMLSAFAWADSADEAVAFFMRLKDQPLIDSKLDELSPDQMREMIRNTHDFCRYGKALRLDRARQAMEQGGLKQMRLSQNQWDALYYEINFGINFTTEIITGYVCTYAASLVSNLNFIELDFLNDMIVDSVVMNGSAVTYSHASNLITVTLDDSYDSTETFAVYVYYHGHPNEGGFQAFAFDYHGSTVMASTLSEPYFARSWWPCKDDPADKADSVDIIITHPDDFVCASNGLVRSIIDNGNGTKTTCWHHGYPITTYLVAISVTNYVEFRNWYHPQPGDSMPVDFFVYPEKLAQAQSSYPITVAMIDTLSGIYGEYPFINEKYGMMQFEWGGAMEHQTNTSMASYAYYQSIIVHELSHQWWGDMITCQNWHEIWMNEGFATYSEALWFESLYGLDYYHDYMDAMQYTDGGTIWCQDTTSAYAIFSSRVYDKGAWVLHMLRHFVGDSTFFEILTTYYDDPRYKWGTITTAQFRDLCIEVTGDSRLYEFFQDWIWGEYYPSYRFSYSYNEYQPDKFVVYVNLRQTQTTNPKVFNMPVDLRWHDGVNYHNRTVYNDQREQDYIVFLDNVQNYPYSMTIDPDGWILKAAGGETYTLHVIADPLDTAHQYYSYLDSVIAAGGTKPYAYYKVGGALPDGVTLNMQTGKITGTPTVSGSFQFKVRVEDDGYPPLDDTVTLILNVAEHTILAGDANFDGSVDVSDAVWIINYVFVGGDPPQPVMEAGEANCDSSVDVSDAVWIINYVFVGGPAPGDC